MPILKRHDGVLQPLHLLQSFVCFVTFCSNVLLICFCFKINVKAHRGRCEQGFELVEVEAWKAERVRLAVGVTQP